MSLNNQQIKAVYVNDPLLNQPDEQVFAFPRSGSYISWESIPITSYNQSGFNVSVLPPSTYIYTDRAVFLNQPVTLTFTGTSQQGGVLLNQQYDAFRNYPLASVMSMLTVKINQSSVSIPLSRCIGSLQRLNHGVCIKSREYSTSAIGMADQTTSYNDLVMSNRNPLGAFSDSLPNTDKGRGGFPMNITTNTATSATISADLTEPLFISPLFFDKLCKDRGSFFALNSFSINVNWENSNMLQRIWSHSNASGSTITNITVTFGQPKLLFRYITPSVYNRMPMNRELSFNYTNVEEYDNPDNFVTLAPGASVEVQSINIQLGAMPSKLLIDVLPKSFNNLTFTDPDTSLKVNSCRVRIMGQDYLSSASAQQLYLMSVKNGLQMDYTEWSGGPVTQFLSGTLTQYATAGGFICVNPTLDCGTPDPTIGAGSSANIQLQIFMNVTNTSSFTVSPNVRVVTFIPGIYTTQGGASVVNVGNLTQLDVLDASKANINFADVTGSESGGSFFGDVGRALAKSWGFLKNDVLPVASQVVPVLKMLRGGAVPTGGCGDCNFDQYGNGLVNYSQGGAMKKKKKTPKGGALVSYNKMKNRLY